MTDTMREKFDRWFLDHAKAPIDPWHKNFAWQVWQAAQADARALVGELLTCIEPNGAFDKVRAKAQAFVEGES